MHIYEQNKCGFIIVWFLNCRRRARAQTNTHARHGTHTLRQLFTNVLHGHKHAHTAKRRRASERATSERVTRAHATTARRVRVFRAVRRTLQTILVPLAWRTMHGRGPCGCDATRGRDARSTTLDHHTTADRFGFAGGRTDGRTDGGENNAQTHTHAHTQALAARRQRRGRTRTGRARTGTGDRRNLSARIGASAHTHTFVACVVQSAVFGTTTTTTTKPTTTSDSDATLGADDVFSGTDASLGDNKRKLIWPDRRMETFSVCQRQEPKAYVRSRVCVPCVRASK